MDNVTTATISPLPLLSLLSLQAPEDSQALLPVPGGDLHQPGCGLADVSPLGHPLSGLQYNSALWQQGQGKAICTLYSVQKLLKL